MDSTYLQLRGYNKKQNVYDKEIKLVGLVQEDSLLSYPRNKALLSMWFSGINGLPSCDQLQKYNPKAIDIRLDCQLASHGILWSAISIGTHDPCGDMRLVSSWTKLCKPKIR